MRKFLLWIYFPLTFLEVGKDDPPMVQAKMLRAKKSIELSTVQNETNFFAAIWLDLENNEQRNGMRDFPFGHWHKGPNILILLNAAIYSHKVVHGRHLKH